MIAVCERQGRNLLGDKEEIIETLRECFTELLNASEREENVSQ